MISFCLCYKYNITSVEEVLTLGCSSVILRMLAPFLPMMKRWSQAGAVTSDVATLFACKQYTVPYISQLQTFHSSLHQSAANSSQFPTSVSCKQFSSLHQSAANSSQFLTSVSCKQFTVPYISQMQTVHSSLHQSAATSSQYPASVTCKQVSQLHLLQRPHINKWCRWMKLSTNYHCTTFDTDRKVQKSKVFITSTPPARRTSPNHSTS